MSRSLRSLANDQGGKAHGGSFHPPTPALQWCQPASLLKRDKNGGTTAQEKFLANNYSE